MHPVTGQYRVYMFQGPRLPEPGEEYTLADTRTGSWYNTQNNIPYSALLGNCASVSHAVLDGPACQVVSCDNGYTVSETKTSCVACALPGVASYGAECAVVTCENGYSMSDDGTFCVKLVSQCRLGFVFDTSQQRCMSDISSCNLHLLKQNADQSPGPAVPGTCNAIFASCSNDGTVRSLSEAEWDACEVDKAMDPTRVQAFAMVDNAPRTGTVSRAEYAAYHGLSVSQVSDLVFEALELSLTSFRHEPLTASQAAFDHIDINNTGRVCCIDGINSGDPFVLRQFEDYIHGLPAAEAQRQLRVLVHSGSGSDLSDRGSAWLSSDVRVSLGAVLVVVLAVGMAVLWRRSKHVTEMDDGNKAVALFSPNGRDISQQSSV